MADAQNPQMKDSIAESIIKNASVGMAPQSIEQLISSIGLMGERAMLVGAELDNVNNVFKEMSEKKLGMVDKALNQKFIKSLEMANKALGKNADATTKYYLKTLEYDKKMEVLHAKEIEIKNKGLMNTLFGAQTFAIQMQQTMSKFSAEVFGKDAALTRELASEDGLFNSLVAAGGMAASIAIGLKFALEKYTYVYERTEDLGDSWIRTGAAWEQANLGGQAKANLLIDTANVFYSQGVIVQEQASKYYAEAINAHVDILGRELTARRKQTMESQNIITNTMQLTSAFHYASMIMGGSITEIAEIGLAYRSLGTPEEIGALATGINKLSQSTGFATDLFIDALGAVGDKMRGTGYSLGQSLRWLAPMMESAKQFGTTSGLGKDAMGMIIKSITGMAGNVDMNKYMAISGGGGSFEQRYMSAGGTNPIQQLQTISSRLVKEASKSGHLDRSKLDIMGQDFGLFKNLPNPEIRTKAMEYLAQLEPAKVKGFEKMSPQEQARAILKTGTEDERKMLSNAIEQQGGRDITAQIQGQLDKILPLMLGGVMGIFKNTARTKEMQEKANASYDAVMAVTTVKDKSTSKKIYASINVGS